MPRKPRSCYAKDWRPMTDEQRKLAEDNHNLIYAYLLRRGLDQDEYYGIAATGLCKAAMTYKPGKYTFATYAYSCMRSEIAHYFTTQKRPCRFPPIPLAHLDAPLKDNDPDSHTLTDMLASETDFTGAEVAEIVARLSTQCQKYLRLYLMGYSKYEICKMTNRSPNAFYASMKWAKKMISRLNLDV